MTFWPLTSYSDFPTDQTFHQFSWPWYRAWPSPNYEWFSWSICNGCGYPAGNTYPSRHLILSSLLGTCLCSNCWNQFNQTCRIFSPWIVQYPLVLSRFSLIANIIPLNLKVSGHVVFGLPVCLQFRFCPTFTVYIYSLNGGLPKRNFNFPDITAPWFWTVPILSTF